MEYIKIVLSKDGKFSEKDKEEAMMEFLKNELKENKSFSLRALFEKYKSFFSQLSKAKVAKIVKKSLQIQKEKDLSIESQISFCRESISWCQAEKRSFLKQRIELTLAELLLERKEFRESLKILKRLIKELKKVEDKLLLIEACLLESSVYSFLNNLPLSKSSLILATTTSNMIYCPPELQAKLDLQSGNVALSEKDYKSAYSHYYESFDGFKQLNQKYNKEKTLTYMLLCKLLANKENEVCNIFAKAVKKYSDEKLDVILKISKAYEKRNLTEFKKVYDENKYLIEEDNIISHNINQIYQSLLEKNITKVVSPYSCVELAHIADKVNLDVDLVEKTISTMILNEKLNGVIDQFKGYLILYETIEKSTVCEKALELIDKLDFIVQKLSLKVSDRNKINKD